MRSRAVTLAAVAALTGALASVRDDAAAQLDPARYADAAEGGAAHVGSGSSRAEAVPGAIPLDERGQPILGVEIPIEDPHGTALAAFHAALTRAARGEGQAHVVVYGASHVAADVWPGIVRRALQASFGDAGHGFVLPVEPWRSYRHMDLRIESNGRRWQTLRARIGDEAPGTYGLAGVAMRTDHAGAFGRIDTGAHPAGRFELWYGREPGGGSLDVLIDGERVERVRTGGTGPGYATFHVEDAPHTFEIRARGDGPVTVYGVSVERETPGVVVDGLGINGFRAAGQLLWDEALFTEHLRRRAPDLVVLAYGTNESGDDEQPLADYERELRQVLARAQGAVPMASCLLVGPSDRPIVRRDGSAEPRARTAALIEVQRRVAGELGCGFFDMVRYGGGPMHMLTWAAMDPAWAQDDHVHYTVRGYTRMGDVMTRALLETYEGPILGRPPVALPIASYVAELPAD
jgi:lysophospholipase L1-like esterase